MLAALRAATLVADDVSVAPLADLVEVVSVLEGARCADAVEVASALRATLQICFLAIKINLSCVPMHS